MWTVFAAITFGEKYFGDRTGYDSRLTPMIQHHLLNRACAVTAFFRRYQPNAFSSAPFSWSVAQRFRALQRRAIISALAEEEVLNPA